MEVPLLLKLWWMGKELNEYDVVKQLKRKSDLRITGKQIQELRKGRGDVGIGSRGKIDYLTKYLGYIHFFVEKFQ